MKCVLLQLVLAALLSALLGTATAAGNSVSGGRVGFVTTPITPDALKPPECSNVTLTAVVVGTGIFGATAASELILGSANADTVTAGDGNDCVLGGGGIDTLLGGNGTDICIGGPGTEILVLFLGCETQIQ